MDKRHYWILAPMILAMGALGCVFDVSGSAAFCPDGEVRVEGMCPCPGEGSEFDPEQNACVVPGEVGDPNTYVCSCKCDLEDDGTNDVVCDGDGCLFDTCMPADLNPNVSPNLGIPPTADELADHCDLVVEKNIEAFYQTCGQLPDTDCACVPVEESTYYEASCNDDCVEDALQSSDCANFDPLAGFKTATNAPGEDPVCLAASSDPPDPTADALAGGFFGQNTLCNITGTAEASVGDYSDTTTVSGRVEFTGAPCPGGGCNVGVLYRVPEIGDFKFEGGFLAAIDLGDEVFIKNSVVSGATVPAAVPIDAIHNGTIPIESTHTSGRGTRKTQLTLRPDPPNVTQAYRGTNSGTVAVTVDWTNQECAISGPLFGSSVEDGSIMSVAIEATGVIANSPPGANAGSDQTVECTGTSGADITLQATRSDLESNIVLTQWLQGGRMGSVLGNNLQHQLTQGLGATDYVVRVVDAYQQMYEDTTRVTVQDTTAATMEVESIGPGVLWPPNGKLVHVMADVTINDVCDGAPTFELATITRDDGAGPEDAAGDYEDADFGSPDTAFYLRSTRPGNGPGRTYTIVYTGTDESGNSSETTATVYVPHDNSGSASPGAGFSANGARIERGTATFELIVPSTSSFDATTIIASGARVGNTRGVLAPQGHRVQDLDADGLDDVGITFSARDARQLIRRSEFDEPLAMRYGTGDGEFYLVPDIFALGPRLDADGAVLAQQ